MTVLPCWISQQFYWAIG